LILAKEEKKMRALLAKGDATMQKTMMKWGQQQEGQLVNITFTCWKEFHLQIKEEAALEAMNQKMKDLAAKGDSTMQKTMMKWGQQQGQQLMGVTFQSWKEDVVEERMIKKMEMMSAQTDAAFKKTMMKLGAEQEGVLLQTTFSMWRDDYITAKEDAEGAEMRAAMASMDAGKEKQMQRFMMKFAGDQAKVLLQRTFAGWLEDVMEIRAEKEAEKMRKDMLSKKDSGLAKMMQKFAGDQRSVMLKSTWTAWTEYHAEVMMQKALDGKKDTQLSRMMGKFARDQGAVLMRTVFGYWLDINKQARSAGGAREARLKNLQHKLRITDRWCTDVGLQTFFQFWIAEVVRARIRKLADKANSVLSKTLGKWGADQESQLLSATLTAWKEALAKRKEDEALDALDKKMKALAEKGDSTLQKTMAKWGAQQAETMLAAITGIWKEFVQKEKEERALEAMNQKMKDLADKGDATLQKTMMKWGAQQAETLVQVTLEAWKEDIRNVKEEAALEAINARMADMAAKGDATLQKTMLAMGQQQGTQLVAITFQAWKEDLVELKAEKQMLAMMEQNEAVFKKTMMKLGNEQDSVLMSVCFAAWRDDYLEALEAAKEEAMRGQMSAEKEAQMAKFMAKFAGDQKSVLLKRMFNGWVEFWKEEVEEREAEKMRASMDFEKDAQMQKLMARFAGEQKGAMQSITFGAWKDETRNSAAERAFLATKKDAGMKFALKMAGGKADVLLRMVFQGWLEELAASANEREKEAERSEFMKMLDAQGDRAKEKKQQMERMVANMVGRNSKQTLTQVVDAWLTEMEKAAKDKKSMWLLDQQESFAGRELNRYKAAHVFAGWSQTMREAGHIKTLQKMEDAIEEERILLKQRCDEYSARTQQAEQDAMYAMAECSRYMKEMEILRAKLDEEMANRKHLENHVSGFRTQVQEQAVRTRTIQQAQAAMTILNVGAVHDREDVDRQLQQLMADQEGLLGRVGRIAQGV